MNLFFIDGVHEIISEDGSKKIEFVKRQDLYIDIVLTFPNNSERHAYILPIGALISDSIVWFVDDIQKLIRHLLAQ